MITVSSIPSDQPSIGTIARKRRRQIIKSQRDAVQPSKKICPEPITSSGTDSNATQVAYPSDTKTSQGKKKPQMKYDPDVPMSKDEAAVWRKEQRRKRNRESAAASRQRQRDRIEELEVEVFDWKSKYEGLLSRLEKLEKRSPMEGQPCSNHVSPCASPSTVPASGLNCDRSCGMVSLQENLDSQVAEEEAHEQENHVVMHLSEKISRPA